MTRHSGKTARPLIYSTMAFVVVAVGSIAMAVWGLRTDTIQQATKHTSEVANLLSEKTNEFVRSIDLTLTEIQHQVHQDTLSSPDDLRSRFETLTVYLLLRERLSRLPQAEFMEVINARGEIINSSREWPRAPTGRGHCSDIGNVAVDRLEVTSTEGRLHFYKTLRGSTGAIVGYACLGVNARYFEAVYDFSTSHSFALIDLDGNVLIRHSEGFRHSGHAPFNAAAEVRPGQDEWGHAGDGGEFRIAVRRVGNYPLKVAVILSRAHALDAWERRATYIVGATLIAVLCFTFLIKALLNQLSQLTASEKALSEREVKLTEKSRELKAANGKLDAAINNMSQGLCMFDGAERLQLCNDRYIELYGLLPETVHAGCTLEKVLNERRKSGTLATNVQIALEEHRAWRRYESASHHTTELSDGRIIAISRQPMPGGAWLSTHEDVTERKRSEARIEHMARHDALTDLANRVLLRDEMDKALGRLRRTGERFCILILDLDLFKTVNDSLGHPVGDALLKAVASEIRRLVRDEDTVARLGGDEFAILLTRCDDGVAAAKVLASRIICALDRPFVVDAHQINIGASVGIAVAPEHGHDAGQLLKNADLALYSAKADGRNCFRFFEPGMDLKAQQRRELEVDLRSAIERNEFELFYQSIIDLATHRVRCAETLVRWRHPKRGLIAPDQFIPLAEELGLVIPIGEWILKRACLDARRLPASVRVAVNLSAVQFRSKDLVDIVRDALSAADLPPERLELEITESVLLQKSDHNISTLHDLKQLGVAVVLDDFGMGYSSLSYLQMFPFNKIKIDRSFVADITTRADSAAIVSAIAALARSLDIETTAEGVETSDQVMLLRASGCTYAQGYLFSRPCPIAELDLKTDDAIDRAHAC